MNPLLKRILIIGAPFLIQRLFRGKKVFRKIGIVLLALIAGLWLYSNYLSPAHKDSAVASYAAKPEFSDVFGLYESQQSGVMVSTSGEVTRILADDNKGSRHQRFIVMTQDKVSVLIAHNIDLASRVPITVGDRVSIRGQYEWNHKGGVIHWTHHDPNKNHPEGWIMHNETKYE